MSEATARALRRDLRRVAGADAVAVLDSHTSHIQGLGALTNANTARLDALERQAGGFDDRFDDDDRARKNTAAALAKQFTDEQHAREAVDRRLTTFEAQTLLGRVRWVLFGAPKPRPPTAAVA